MTRSCFVIWIAGLAVVGCEPSTGDLGSGGNTAGSTGTSPNATTATVTVATSGGFNATTNGGSSTTGGPGACTIDDDCPAGAICQGGTCEAGCTMQHGCDGSKTCCGGECFDLATDVTHCGGCDVDCTTAMNIDVTCDGTCQYGACAQGYFDCDGTLGCESLGACLCTANEVQPCYLGPMGTQDVGACVAGTRTCNATGTAWGACLGWVGPDNEICANGIDEDCNGVADDVPDLDGDGWTACQGDCCDSVGAGCASPELVNPGAFEAGGNMVDDNCDGIVDNVLGGCDGALGSSSGNALDYATAIDLCQTTEENPADPAQRKWGVISAALSLANGAGTPNANSRSIRFGFGPGVTPLGGTQLAVLSSGVAAANTPPNNTNPNFASPQNNNEGQNMGTSSAVPNDWLVLNGGNLPNAPGCPGPQGGNVANDPVMLKVRVRVPTNAQSFSVSSVFYSSEYPEWVCSPFNDFFVALLDSSFAPSMGQQPNPIDKNLAVYTSGANRYPVGVNLAFGNTGLFSQCQNGATGCGPGSVGGSTNSCQSTAMLVGTGFDVANPPFHCGAGNMTGGATGWLTTSGNVRPGEVIEVRFAVWDTGDHIYDSTLLLDNFQWSVNPSTPGTDG